MRITSRIVSISKSATYKSIATGSYTAPQKCIFAYIVCLDDQGTINGAHVKPPVKFYLAPGQTVSLETPANSSSFLVTEVYPD